MRKRREPTITFTIRGAEAAWRLLESDNLSEKRCRELLDVLIKETSPQQSYMALKHERAALTRYSGAVRDALVKVILDSGIDAPVYLTCIMQLDPPTKYRSEVIEAFGSRSAGTAMTALDNAEEFRITVAERDMLIRRVLAPKRPLGSKSSDASLILALFDLPASAQRRELVEAAAFPRYHYAPALKMLQDEKRYFKTEPPTEEELATLIASAYSTACNEQLREDDAAALFLLPQVVERLKDQQKSRLKEIKKKCDQRKADWEARFKK